MAGSQAIISNVPTWQETRPPPAVAIVGGLVACGALLLLTPPTLLPRPVRRLREAMGSCCSASTTRPADEGTAPPAWPNQEEPLARSAAPPAGDNAPDTSPPLQGPTLEPRADRKTGALAPPPSQLTPSVWRALELQVVPMHLQGRKLRQVFSTTEHGYNYETLKRRVLQERTEDRRTASTVGLSETTCLVLIWVGEVVLGGLCNVLPEWNTKGSRMYLGSTATTVFRIDALPTGEDPVYIAAPCTAYRGLDEADGGNERFLRADDHAVSFGAGGGGSALRLTSKLTSVKCYAPSETFQGLRESLLADALARGQRGVSKDVDCIEGTVREVEVYRFTEDTA